MTSSGDYSMKRRNELARAKGFRSYGEQRRYSAKIENRTALERLPRSAQEVRQASIDIFVEARRTGRDVAEIAAREGVPVEAVLWWADGTVRKQGGRLTVAPGDRLLRPMHVVSAGRVEMVDVRGDKVARKINAYHQAIDHYLRTGDGSKLAKFTGTTVGGVELETDLDVIDELQRRGTFTFESIYRTVA